ncbi:PREDICTED: PERQ amino acid-rich with GYF domain-containing protein 2-like [Polistes dominula]|uniref:PERQ amino acid-rich with GYF domain-containing protein 2-like n=1 Tax=Polistes dominula TaxID=743375 RepID=A0ABM1INU6_POLDO|nr:PREDICTED: PERQ amino acid-rich with GYF domain-containing protein 2-like [Polistes dominula]
MASYRTTLRPDLQTLLDNFTQLKNVYLSLKTFSNIQDELLQYEKVKSAKMEEEMKKMTKTFTLLEEQRKKSLEEVRKENEELKKALFESREECNHLRFIYVDRNIEDEQICKLQDELEVLKSNLALQEERHKEEMFELERKYTEEIQKYKILLETRQQYQNKMARHPGMDDTSNQQSQIVKIKKIKKKDKQPTFRWPGLNVSKASQILNDLGNEDNMDKYSSEKVTRKKKLYCENTDAIVDI